MRRHAAHAGEEIVEPAVDVPFLDRLAAHDSVDEVSQLGHPAPHARAVVVQVDPVDREPEDEADEHDAGEVAGDRLAARQDEPDEGEREEEPQHRVVEELLRGDGHEDEPMGRAALAKGVVGDHPATDAARREHVAHGEAAERDGEHVAQTQADVEHVEDEAREIGVAEHCQALQHHRAGQKHVAGVREQRDRLLHVDELRQQKIEDDDDDREDGDMAEGLLDRLPPQSTDARQAQDSTTRAGGRAAVRRARRLCAVRLSAGSAGRRASAGRPAPGARRGRRARSPAGGSTRRRPRPAHT